MKHKYSMYFKFTDMVNEKGIVYASNYAKECGFTAVEFLLSADENSQIPDSETAREYKSVLEKKSISVACVSCGASLVSESAPNNTLQHVVEKLKKCVDFAKNVGSPMLHHTLLCKIDTAPKAKYEDIYASVLNGAVEVANYAEEYGIRVIYEPQGWYFNGCERFLRFFTDITKLCRNTGVCFDVGNTYWVDEEPYDLLRKIKDYVHHVHIKDYILNNEESEAKTLGNNPICEIATGSGIIKIKDIIEELDRIGYNGYLSIEDSTEIATKESLDSIKALTEN